MSGGHTPGPFVARRAVNPDNTGGYDWAIIAPGKAIIAECFEHVGWREKGVSFGVGPVEANAHLFAAAPDLLEAVEAMIAVQEWMIEHGCNDGPLPDGIIEECARRNAAAMALAYDAHARATGTTS